MESHRDPQDFPLVTSESFVSIQDLVDTYVHKLLQAHNYTVISKRTDVGTHYYKASLTC